jgi:hypothetical protein
VGLCLARVELGLGGLHARAGVGLHVQETNGRFSQLRRLLATLTASMRRSRTAPTATATAHLTWRRRAAILTWSSLFMRPSRHTVICSCTALLLLLVLLARRR